MKRVAVLLADGCEEVEAVTPIDFLRRAGIEVTVLGVTGVTVTGGHGIAIQADMPIAELTGEAAAALDAVVIPGGTAGAENIAASVPAMKLIRDAAAGDKLIAAICAAPGVVLGPTGLLNGRRFTCFPGFESRVPGGQFSEDRVVVDGRFLTSRAAGSAAEFALAVIAYLVDAETAGTIRERTLQPV